MLARIALGALLLTALTVTIVPDEAQACRPMTWICPLNFQYYHTCGGTVTVPPIVQCAEDTLRDATLP